MENEGYGSCYASVILTGIDSSATGRWQESKNVLKCDSGSTRFSPFATESVWHSRQDLKLIVLFRVGRSVDSFDRHHVAADGVTA